MLLKRFKTVAWWGAVLQREGEQAWGVQLRNKPPHWNDSLRCWCLNFRGRVKLASVKNFQLISVADPTKAIAMQARAPLLFWQLATAPPLESAQGDEKMLLAPFEDAGGYY